MKFLFVLLLLASCTQRFDASGKHLKYAEALCKNYGGLVLYGLDMINRNVEITKCNNGVVLSRITSGKYRVECENVSCIKGAPSE